MSNEIEIEVEQEAPKPVKKEAPKKVAKKKAAPKKKEVDHEKVNARREKYISELNFHIMMEKRRPSKVVYTDDGEKEIVQPKLSKKPIRIAKEEIAKCNDILGYDSEDYDSTES